MAKVLHEFGFMKEAYKIVQNSDHKFEIALQLGLTREGNLIYNIAHKIATAAHSTFKIRMIGDLSLKKG